LHNTPSDTNGDVLIEWRGEKEVWGWCGQNLPSTPNSAWRVGGGAGRKLWANGVPLRRSQKSHSRQESMVLLRLSQES
jgi:hypothetical protein